MSGHDGNGFLTRLIFPRRRPVLPLLVFAAGALATLAAWQGRVGDDRLRGQTRFDGAVRAVQTDINTAFAHYEQVLRAGQGFAGGAGVGRADWRRFARALDLGGQFPGIKGLALIRPVREAGRDAFLAERRRDDPDFHIFPDGKRPDYLVNTFVEPADAAAPAVGFDVGSSPPRRAALERARDGGTTALTEPVALLAPSKSGSDFLMYLPVWRDGPPPETPEQRRAALTGWVGLAFSLSETMRGITLQHPDVDIDIYVGGQPEPGNQIYDSQDDESLSGVAQDEQALYGRAALLPVGGHLWLLSLRSTPAFEAAVASGEPLVVLVAGLALSLLLAVTIGLLQHGRARALALADHRAGALETSEARYRRIIESTLEGYWELDAAGRTVTVNDALCRLLGVQPEELTARPPDAFTADPAKGELAALVAASPSSPQRSVEIVLRHRNGEPVPARFNITAFVDADGRVSRVFALISDISAEQQRRQELLSGQERLRQIVSAVPFAMLITRPSEGEILHANPHAVALFGLGGAEEDGEAVLAPAEHFWLDPDDRREFIETVWRDGRVDSRELRLRRLDGSGFWAILSAQLFVYDGDAALLVGIQDSDRLRRTEEALAAAEARARTVIDNAGIGIILADLEGRLIEVNPAFARLLGRDAAALAGERWIDLTHPEDRERNLALLDSLISGAVDRYEMEKRVVTADGGAVWVATVVTRVPGPDGRPAMIVGMIEDVTARIEAEQSLRTLWRALDAAPISVVITDVDGRIEYANPETERVTGFGQAEMIGQNPRIFQSGHTEVSVYERMWTTILAGEVWQGEMINRRRDGTLFWEAAWIAPVRDARGRISHFVGLKQDISERRRTEEALRASEQRFRQMFENNRAVQLLIEPASGRIVDANAAAVRYYGYARDTLRTMTIFQINALPPAEVVAALALAPGGGEGHLLFPAPAGLGRGSRGRSAFGADPDRRHAAFVLDHPRRHPAQGSRGGGGAGARGSRGRQPCQVALPRHYESRTAHAAQHHPRLLGDHPRHPDGAGRAAALRRIRRRHPRKRQPPAGADQRHSRHRQGRVRQAADRAGGAGTTGGGAGGGAAALGARPRGRAGNRRRTARPAAAADCRPARAQADSVQPAVQRHQVHPPRRPHHPFGGGRCRRRRAAAGAGYRHRHPPRSARPRAEAFRTDR